MIHFSGIKNDRESPEWMVKKLTLLGQRSVNPVVDITNYLMYSFGQPVHAFGARSVATNKKGERLTVLGVPKDDPGSASSPLRTLAKVRDAKVPYSTDEFDLYSFRKVTMFQYMTIL